MESLRAQAGADYDILGSLGRRDESTFVYLARETSSGDLIALTLRGEQDDEDGAPVFSIEIKRELDASVPDPETLCPRCSARLRRWARFCTQCRLDVSGISATSGANYSRAALLDAVRSNAGDDYEVLGEMSRAGGGGLVYFARERSNRRLVALRLDREGEDEYSVNVTRVLKPLVRRESGAKSPARISLVRRMTDEERRYVASARDVAGSERRKRASSGAGSPSTRERRERAREDRRLVVVIAIAVVLGVALLLALVA